MTTYRILLDGVDLNAVHEDRQTAIDLAENFAKVYPGIRVDVNDGDESVYSVAGYRQALLAAAAPVNSAHVWTFNPDALDEFARQMAQRKASGELCDKIVNLLGVVHTSVHPNADGEMILMTESAAARLYDLANRKASAKAVYDLAAGQNGEQ